MKEIHEIRERIYKETKGMSIQERIAYTKKRVDEVEKESGVKLRRLVKTT